MRATPLIAWGLSASVAALPLSAFALGLGRLSVDSGLGQPLSARVELTAAQKDELESLAAKIVDLSIYRDNNVQYPAVLSRARVSVEQSPNSPPYLKITTTQAVNEPFIDLIVELNWATGRVVRNYTFLLDPPGIRETQAVEPVAPARAEAAPARSARAQRATPAAAAPSGAAGDSYTVRRGDTLSKIAKEYKPANVSLEQMLVALFRTNESAFDGRNMNRLRTGQILTIPAADQAVTPTQSEATKVVRVQAADWRAYRDRVAGAAPTIEAAETRQAASGKITTAVEEKGVAPQPGKDQLRVSREAGKGAAAAGTSAEDLAAKDRALREANSRVADLEKTLRDMQKAAELKSQTMSDLQKQAEAAKAAKAPEPPKTEPAKVATAPTTPLPSTTIAPTPSAGAPATSAPAAPAAVTPPVVTPPSPASVAPAKAPETKAPEAKAPETKAPEAKAPEPVAPQAKAPEAKAPETKAPETKAPETKAAATPVKTAKTQTSEPSFFDELISNTPTWAIAAGALGILALIAGLIAARRRKTTKFEDSIISGTDIKTNTVFGSTGGGVVNTGDNSLASDFSREGLGNIDTDEVDPIAEAEVYLAYGRDAQAEEILKEALKKDPQRQEIYLKLLEIHAQHNKPSAFETVASELYSVSGGQGEVWQKAMALGRQLDPNNPLFAEAGGTAAFAAAAAAPSEPAPAPVESDRELSIVPPGGEMHAMSAAPEAKADRGIDFALDEDISLSPTSGVAPEAKTPAAILAGAAQEVAKSTRSTGDGETTRGGVPTGAAATAAAGAASFAKGREGKPEPEHDVVSFEPESVPKFDLDFNLDEPSRPGPTWPMTQPPAATKPAAPKPAAEPALAAVGASAPAPQLARPAAAIELDKLDLAFDPARSTFEDPTPSVLDGQWHDAATKLDLAKAYQEMGDVEGAREILQEVLHEGDDQQKAEAQSLLSKLG